MMWYYSYEPISIRVKISYSLPMIVGESKKLVVLALSTGDLTEVV